MISTGSTKKIFALILLLALFGARINAVTYSVFVLPIQDHISKTEFLADAGAKPKMSHANVKGLSADVSVPFADFALVEMVFDTRIVFPSAPEKDLPEGYRTIFIPPA